MWRGVSESFFATKLARPYRFLRNQEWKEKHLPFASRLSVLVELAQLEYAEQRLNGRGGVRVGSRVHDWYLHFSQV